VQNLSRSPFRKGSVRDRVYRFLQTPRSPSAFVKYVKRLGADPFDLMRFFRKSDLVSDEKGLVRIAK
jgi:hypothetical protein